MSARKVVLAAALAVLAACSENPVSPDGTILDASRTKGGNGIPTAPPPPMPVLIPIPVGGNPISGAAFWINPASSAKLQADAWRVTRPADAADMDKIAGNSQAQWLDGRSPDILATVNSAVTAAVEAAAVPILVAYNIPQRDCGGLSAGGTTAAEYRSWIAGFARGLAGRKAVVILEPDALTQMDCLSAADQATRINLIQYAIGILKEQPNVHVYLDGGNSAWKSASDQASRLARASVTAADGFAVNVANFQFTSSSIAYGKAISDRIGGKHFIIDTSRNGLGPTLDNQWCNPDGRALGIPSTTVTGDSRVDAYLWIKIPGESDGACNGAPVASSWWADYALGLAQRSAL
ncbi:MAG: glycoside hydrolase family 6 protein [Gemmatimonadota bacterium]|nr:glycoside hydrolase family 6 protein [Gemmatimonadota bacterium]